MISSLQQQMLNCLCLGMLLSGCQTKPIPSDDYAQDGAPKYPKMVKFQQPQPQNLPLSRYGNRAEYIVDGKTYAVMPSAKGYHERGVASWYGTKFHKHRTSSGEKYNMYQATAAHKTLPLPTYVLVRNLENGREAVVKVNDRGPFHADRILDLSYAAAKKLGIYQHGTAAVEVTAMSQSALPAHYYIQAGAYSNPANAKARQQQISSLIKQKVNVIVDKGSYVVMLGPFKDSLITKKCEQNLAKNGIDNVFALLR